MPMLKGAGVQDLYRRGAHWLAGQPLERWIMPFIHQSDLSHKPSKLFPRNTRLSFEQACTVLWCAPWRGSTRS